MEYILVENQPMIDLARHLGFTFEEISADITERCVPPFRQALSDAKLDASKIDEIVLVGGSTRMPALTPRAAAA